MTFDQWMKKQNSAYKKTDDSVFLRGLRNAWIAATKYEREECAKVCDERAEKCAAKLETTVDQDDRTELKANAWQFSVLAAEIRKRSNV